eukprot:3375333-Rhodomonas_salina.2
MHEETEKAIDYFQSFLTVPNINGIKEQDSLLHEKKLNLHWTLVLTDGIDRDWFWKTLNKQEREGWRNKMTIIARAIQHKEEELSSLNQPQGRESSSRDTLRRHASLVPTGPTGLCYACSRQGIPHGIAALRNLSDTDLLSIAMRAAIAGISPWKRHATNHNILLDERNGTPVQDSLSSEIEIPIYITVICIMAITVLLQHMQLS